MNRDPSEFDSGHSSDDDVLGDLAAKREELRIAIHDLRVSTPPIALLLFGAALIIVFLLASLFLIVAPYVHAAFPKALSLAAAFAAVVLAFPAYAVLRRFSSQHERRRLHRTVEKRARYLQEMADELLREGPRGESEFTPRAAGK
jgi:uncharacterized membrane protein YccC